MASTSVIEEPAWAGPARAHQDCLPNSSDRMHWDQLVGRSRIIAAVRRDDKLAMALDSPVEIVYLLYGNPVNLGRMVASVRKRGKLPFVNADLLQGLSRDASAVEFLAHCGAAGIISTHHETLRAARAQGLISVLRTFTIDTAAVDAGRRFLTNFQPDAMELLPAVAAPLVVPRMRTIHPSLRIIAGGLVDNMQTITQLIDARIDAVSVGDPALWVV